MNRVTQGHTYQLGEQRVMAMESGEDRVTVAVIDDTQPWPLTARMRVDVGDLVGLPMVYFGGQVPR